MVNLFEESELSHDVDVSQNDLAVGIAPIFIIVIGGVVLNFVFPTGTE